MSSPIPSQNLAASEVDVMGAEAEFNADVLALAPEVDVPVPGSEDIEAGLRFLHLMGIQTKAQVSELTASVNALLEQLIASGVLPIENYQQRRQLTVVRENERVVSEAMVALDTTPDKYELTELPRIDCENRMHLCRARCCSFTFPLSVQDLDERVVRWNYGAPYQNARRGDGYCVHNKAGTHHCEVYAHRPAVCRSYDCRQDQRVWIDFDRRIPVP